MFKYFQVFRPHSLGAVHVSLFICHCARLYYMLTLRIYNQTTCPVSSFRSEVHQRTIDLLVLLWPYWPLLTGKPRDIAQIRAVSWCVKHFSISKYSLKIFKKRPVTVICLRRGALAQYLYECRSSKILRLVPVKQSQVWVCTLWLFKLINRPLRLIYCHMRCNFMLIAGWVVVVFLDLNRQL